jgi:CRP-like cAMP-binding protein
MTDNICCVDLGINRKNNFLNLFSPLYLILITELVKLVKNVPRNSTLKAGDFFGQEVIMDQQKYAATVVSLQTTTGWKIDRTALTQTVDAAKLRRSGR